MSLWGTLVIGFVHCSFLTCFMRKYYLLCCAKADNAFGTQLEINMHIHISSVLYLGNQWHSNICSAALRKRSCSSLSDRDAASERSAEFTCIDPVQGADETLQLLGNLSSANRGFSPPGENILLKKGLLTKSFCLVMICKKNPKIPTKKPKNQNPEEIFKQKQYDNIFLNNNNVYHC